MTFPTIPTVAAGRVLFTNQADTSQTRTFPSLSSLTKNAGDLLIAIVVTYQSTTNPQFTSWGGGFTEMSAGGDQGSATTMGIGIAWKISTGSETGTFTVTQATTITGHASMCLLSIPLANSVIPPEAGTIANGTASGADPGSFNPAGWGTEDTLWIAVDCNGMTSGTGSWTKCGAGTLTNYSNLTNSNTTDSSTIGQTEVAVSFRQLNAASEDRGAVSTHDTSNARNSALIIAVPPVITGALAGTSTTTFSAGSSTMGGVGALGGTSTASFTPAAAMTGAAQIAGTLTASFTGSGTIAGDGILAGTSTASFTGSGTMESVASEALAGSSTLTFAPVAVLVGGGALAGSSTAAFAPTGTAFGAGALAGSCTAAFAPSAALAGAGALAGSLTATFTPSGTLELPSGAIAGTSALAFSGGASILQADGVLSGLSSLSFTPQGVLLADGAIAGSSVLALVAAAGLDGSGALAGPSALSFTGSGTAADLAGGAMAGFASLTFTCTVTIPVFSSSPRRFSAAAPDVRVGSEGVSVEERRVGAERLSVNESRIGAESPTPLSRRIGGGS